MFPPLPTTPFKNSPSIDALSPRSTHLTHFRMASLENPSPLSQPIHHQHSANSSSSASTSTTNIISTSSPSHTPQIVGDPRIGSDVPVELLRSVILSGSLSQSNQSCTTSASTSTSNSRLSPSLSCSSPSLVPISKSASQQSQVQQLLNHEDDHTVIIQAINQHPSSLPRQGEAQGSNERIDPTLDPSQRDSPNPNQPFNQDHHPIPPTSMPSLPLLPPSLPSTAIATFTQSYWNSTTTIAYTPAQIYPPIKHLPGHHRKRILVTGGAGFVGSHLVDRLMFMGHDVTVLDNFFSGSKTAVAHWIGHPNFELIRHDVVDPFMIECDQIYHLACPASPVAYQYNSIKTMKTNFLGTMNMLGLAKRTKARFLLSSTSEVYGSPEQHPQKETYWGHVNPIGPRACYDEGKRVAESLTYGYARENGVEVRVARIFNTYGPRMSPSDGRLVSNFIMRAIRGEPIEVYGDGEQTRSLMYIFDLIDGLIKLMNSDHPSVIDSPVNLGTTDEKTVNQWANLVIKIIHEIRCEQNTIHSSQHHHPIDNKINDDQQEQREQRESLIIHKSGLPDDPPRRKPDITKAMTYLDWKPEWPAEVGLRDTVKFFSTLVNSGFIS